MLGVGGVSLRLSRVLLCLAFSMEEDRLRPFGILGVSCLITLSGDATPTTRCLHSVSLNSTQGLPRS